ncbi:DUF5947 family protein [Actinomadura bangladeshensis]|uniref:Uncharacterized protein n=1 Tax=Actinomadura bangladeshensis TaxID=453573 RepID=A0A4R4PB26_9ACTN|nr:DUF5947 family protein [Actinomadura bangladeshensis]TDC18207.1 hypothetical protein E1284_07000 [Actinomadura bangladeshensis]
MTTSGALGRAILRSPTREREDTCGLCDVPIVDGHAHVLDERTSDLLCACRACALLFEKDGAGVGHYRLVPDRRVRLTGVSVADLGVPVRLAFFVVGLDGAVVARYPSPLGATEWTVDPPAWTAVSAQNPELASMLPAVEALLTSSIREADEQWLVPIDDCYRLVAVIKEAWTGLSGGDRVWTAVEAFFTGLADRYGRPGASARPHGSREET